MSSRKLALTALLAPKRLVRVKLLERLGADIASALLHVFHQAHVQNQAVNSSIVA